MMHQVYLSLGSNMGDRIQQLKSAQKYLKMHEAIKIIHASSYYQTSPVGGVVQDDFINQALLIETNLSPYCLLDYIHEIEAKLHRERIIRWGPRTVDIDILFFDHKKQDDPKLILPHPQVFNRLFVLIPLREIMQDDFYQKDAVLDAIELLEAQGQQKIERV
ncbi:hypothetical protein TOTSKI_14940 [Facklamia hominis]